MIYKTFNVFKNQLGLCDDDSVVQLEFQFNSAVIFSVS